MTDYDTTHHLLRESNGQWVERVYEEPEGSVINGLTTASPSLTLDDGEDLFLDTQDTYGPLKEVQVSREDVDGDEVYRIDVTQILDYRSLVSDEVGDDDAKDEWLNARSGIIEDFMAARYGAQLDGGADDWTYVRTEMRVEHRGDLTEAAAFEFAYEDTKAVDLFNEYDAGTYGSEYLGRLLADHVEKFSVVSVRRGLQPLMDEVAVTREVDFRSGHNEIRDLTAISIAAELSSGDPSVRGQLRQLAVHGYAERDLLRDELRELYASPDATRRLKMRLDAMFTWNDNGADNNY
jgi:hypothetical protein